MHYTTTFSAGDKNLLSPVIEESRFISLNNHNVKQLPPVLPYNVGHPSVAITDETSQSQQLVTTTTSKLNTRVIGWLKGTDKLNLARKSKMHIRIVQQH